MSVKIKTDLATLREIAKRAPNPQESWWKSGDQVESIPLTICTNYYAAIGEDPPRPDIWERAAAFIAAFDPPTVLSLLDRIEKLEEPLRNSGSK